MVVYLIILTLLLLLVFPGISIIIQRLMRKEHPLIVFIISCIVLWLFDKVIIWIIF
jgi:hypothetical protein